MIEREGFRLVNDPGYWGGADPVVLVLGQTKGRNQWRAVDAKDFDSIAFAGIRNRLHKVLSRIGVVADTDEFEARFSGAEKDFGFASLLRCSLSTLDGKSSGSPIIPAMKTSAGVQWVCACIERWLMNPNPRLRLVVLLGVSDAYVQAVLALLKELNPGTYRPLSNTAATIGCVTWIFAQHPSGVSENHYQRWIGEEPSVKRDAAIRVVRNVLAHPVFHGPRRMEGAVTVSSETSRPVVQKKSTPKHTPGDVADSATSVLRQAIQSRLMASLDIFRHGHLGPQNKKMSDWRTKSGHVFTHDYGAKYTDHLWVKDNATVRSLGIEMRLYPSTAIESSDNRHGEAPYGRHSALRTIPELRNADLVRLTPKTMSDVERVLEILCNEAE